MKNVLIFKLCFIAALTAGTASAQAIQALHPANAVADVPAAHYDSAFSGYAPFRDDKLAPWREVNDEVARAGGHIGILRSEAAAAKPAPGAKPDRSRP